MTSADYRATAGRVWTIARRELQSLFDHPTGYVLLVVMLAGNAFLFFRQAYLQGLASMRPMLDLLPWLFLFFVPAVCMRTLAEDQRSGLLEVTLTQPVTEIELIAGKFAGAVLFLWIALGLTLPIPLGLALGAHMQWGVLVAQYVGAALLAAGLAGVGVWASSLTRSQITAFILAVAVTFVLILVGLDPLIVGLPPTLGVLAARLGVLSHFESIGRGVIDLRDALYFISLAAATLALAYLVIAGRRLAREGVRRKQLRTGVALIVATLVVVNLLGGYIGGRLDLTPGHTYTLSRGTRAFVGKLDDLLTVKVFASDELPTEAALMKRDVDDLLSDIRSAGHGKIRIVRENPAKDSVAARDARTLGVVPVQFNVIGSTELQVKEGYLGLVMQYGSGHETIPFIQRTDDLEYRIASAVRSLTRTGKPVVGFVEAGPPPDPQQQRGDPWQDFRAELERTYTVRPIALGDTAQPARDVSALVLAGSPQKLDTAALAQLRAYFRRGGGALVLAGAAGEPSQVPMIEPRDVAWNEMLKPFGVSVRSDVVYDLASNAMIPARGYGPFQVMQRYPFFVRAQSTGSSIVNRDVRDVLVPWPSSIDTSRAASGTVTPLVVTTKNAGASTGMTMIDPSRELPQTDLAPRLLAVQVMPKAGGDSTARGRVIVVGNSEFVMGQFARGAPENLAFALNAVDWLAQDESLISIRNADRRPPTLAFTSVPLREGVKYAGMIGVPALVAMYGALRMARRRGQSRVPYRPLAAGAERAASHVPAVEGA